MKWVHETISNNTVTLDFTQVEFKTMQPMAAALYTVDTIVRDYPAPYNLMLSGGVDSQAMLWAWYQSGHEFKAYTVRYNTDMNDFDLVQLIEFTDKYDIPITFVDFDLLNFLQNEYDAWANTYNCSSPQICAHMKFSSMIPDGTSIFSGNFIDSQISILNYTIMGIIRYASICQKSIVPFFFLETPELAYAFDLYTTTDNIDWYSRKIEAYHAGGFPVIRQNTKYSGFEKVKDYYDVTYDLTVQYKLQYSGNLSCRTFDLMLRYPYDKKFNTPKLINKYLRNTI